MRNQYVIYAWIPVEGQKPLKPTATVAQHEQEMLDRVVELTKKDIKFAVYQVGECVGDYS